MPTFLLTTFSKNEKVDLLKAEKNELRKLIPILVQRQRNQRRGPWPRKSKGK
jgi:hypothetical protein